MTNEEFAILKQNQREAQGLPLRTKRAVTMGEAELERTCTNMLVLDGWRALKTNPVSRRARGAGFGELGMADYLYIRYLTPQTLWIEWKRADGEAAPHQIMWIERERARGALVWLAGVDFDATPEAFWTWYQSRGLCRTNLEPVENCPFFWVRRT